MDNSKNENERCALKISFHGFNLSVKLRFASFIINRETTENDLNKEKEPFVNNRTRYSKHLTFRKSVVPECECILCTKNGEYKKDKAPPAEALPLDIDHYSISVYEFQLRYVYY